jgi:putative secretion ATPase (PEP-CTERM system associated)
MYESYYGLNSKPFQLTPDPEFFFASKLHKRAMSYLQYGLSQAEGFIVITGDIGTGKTTIANSLLNNIEEDIFAAQIVTPKLSPDELLKMVASKFNLPAEGRSKADLLESIQNFLQQLHASGKRALLLVDEAQNLPLETIEELRMLSNFQLNSKPLLQSFLLGQAELQPILRAPNMEQFRQRIVASCHLTPLNRDEMKEYVEHRLHHAGCTKDNLIADDAYDVMYQFTNGVPRKTNTLMDRVLLYGFLEEIAVFSVEDVNNVIEEVKAEMFIPTTPEFSDEDADQRVNPAASNSTPSKAQAPSNKPETEFLTPNGNKIQEASYYKEMLGELVDALDDAIKHKIKLTQYIDKMLKQKYQAYVRLKKED